MPLGDIQLNSAALVVSPDPVVVGEAPNCPDATVDELRDTALSRPEVENFLFEIHHQPSWRREADRDADYYDNNQLSPELVETLKDRGQPPLIANIIKPTIDTVLGMEAKTRSDWRVRPEDDEYCDDELAEALSVKLKHAETESRADRAVSDAYAAQCKSGLGWIEVARESDPFKARYRIRYVHRREIFWDWRAEQPDLSDARYLIRRRWLELDHAIAMMPQYAELMRQTVSSWSGFDPLVEQDTRLVHAWDIERDTRLSAHDWRDTQRQRVCLYEIWYRKWVSGHVMTLPNGTLREVDFNNPKHAEAILAGLVPVHRATFQKVRLAWYVGPHFLYDLPSPYQHRLFPYVPFFGYREDLTGTPYGLIRAMISPQDEINARKSKLLWQLNSRRVIADADAVVDHASIADEIARSDAYVILNANRRPDSIFKVESGGELAAQQFQSMQESKEEIAQVSGIHKAMMGQNTNASSGLAINSLIEQGMNTLAEINDNYRFSRRLVGEMLFDLLKQDLSRNPARVTIGEGRKKKIIVLNQPSIDPQTGQPLLINDVSKVNAKVVLDDIPSTPTYRMQQLQMLTEITKSLPPQLQGAIVDFVVEATDMPKRHELADRLRAAAGITDPDQPPSPEQMQMQAESMQLQREMALTALEEQRTKVREINARAGKIESELAGAETPVGIPPEVEAQIQQLQQQAAEQIDALSQQLRQAQLDAANQTLSIDREANTRIETARIEAEAKVRVAEIQSASDQALNALETRMQTLIDGLQQKLQETEVEEKPAPELPPPPAPVTLNVQIDAKAGTIRKTLTVDTDREGRITGGTVMEEEQA